MSHEIVWPDVAICREPLFKDEELFEKFHVKADNKSFHNFDEFREEVDQAFYKAEEIIQDVIFGDSYLNSFYEKNETHQLIPNAKSYEIKPPLVKRVQADFLRTGSCAILSLMTAKKIMIEKGYTKFSDENDSDFIAIIYLKVKDQYYRVTTFEI